LQQAVAKVKESSTKAETLTQTEAETETEKHLQNLQQLVVKILWGRNILLMA
jgi:hypothetical protein